MSTILSFLDPRITVISDFEKYYSMASWNALAVFLTQLLAHGNLEGALAFEGRTPMDWTKPLESAGSVMSIKLITIGATIVTPGSLLIIVLILGVTLLVSRSIQLKLVRVFNKRGIHDEETIYTARRVVHWALLLCGITAALQTIGIDLSTLFAAGAVFAVGLGLAMQSIVQNFVSGVILLVGRSIKPGDVLEMEDQVVRVEHMGIRSTVARTRSKEELIIPNSILVQNTVKNFTKEDSLYLLKCPVGVTYNSDLKLVRETLVLAAESVPWRVTDREPRVFLREFGDSAVVFDVRVWITDPWISRALISDLNEAIWWALKKADIVIAFPQLDVHLDPPVEESIRLASGSARH
ncbi:MAG: mechanosensitive ion channel [Deltaproteobacteria bacterium]|nr:mechanosensitive ion channel [Deltaproteobacteria bacterium]